MAQEERLKYLINYLLNEQPEYSNINIPESFRRQKTAFAFTYERQTTF